MSRFRSYVRSFGFATVCAILLMLMYVSDAKAQNILTFTADTTTGTESVVPVLTWDTMPLADDCFASGDWSGNKGGAGNETLLPITSGATYNLTCEWSDDSATLTWTAPTENTDGTPLTDLDGYFDGGPYTLNEDVGNPGATSYVLSPLTPGDWFFVGTAYNVLGVESVFSNQAMKTVGVATDQQSIGITVNPRPNSMGGFAVQ